MNLIEHLGEEWHSKLRNEFHQPYMTHLQNTLKLHSQKHNIFPSTDNIFRAFRTTPLSTVKVVILGQDPYYTPKNANGLAFSIPNDLSLKTPPSLINIFKEIESDYGFSVIHDPDLTRWAEQGVLLLNTALTVLEGQPNSHKLIWKLFTEKVISIVSSKKEPVVFILWGANAQSYNHLITEPHDVIMSAHPSPLSAHNGFFGSRCFTRCNKFLKVNYNTEIYWI